MAKIKNIPDGKTFYKIMFDKKYFPEPADVYKWQDKNTEFKTRGLSEMKTIWVSFNGPRLKTGIDKNYKVISIDKGVSISLKHEEKNSLNHAEKSKAKSIDDAISKLQTEIKKQDEDIARYQKNIEESQAKRAKLLFELSEKDDVSIDMPWQKTISLDEAMFIISTINRYSDSKTKATSLNWKSFKFSEVKEALLKLKDKNDHLSSEGIATRDSIFKKLNIS